MAAACFLVNLFRASALGAALGAALFPVSFPVLLPSSVMATFWIVGLLFCGAASGTFLRA